MFNKISDHKNVRMFLINNFLDSSFDDCIDDAISIYIKEESNINKKFICKEITKFIESDINIEDKNEFIMHNAGICYELIQKEPILWLEDIRDKILVHCDN